MVVFFRHGINTLGSYTWGEEEELGGWYIKYEPIVSLDFIDSLRSVCHLGDCTD
jgi:hypothetical protein